MTTIYDALAERLGRKPTHDETKAEVRRILQGTFTARRMGKSHLAQHLQTLGRIRRVQS